MLPTLVGSKLQVTVHADRDAVRAEIRDGRQDSVGLFGDLDEDQRAQLAGDAWIIGLRALANAYASAQEARLQDVGAELVQDVGRQLTTFVEHQSRAIEAVLSRYFDARDGEVSQRLREFLADEGTVGRLLKAYLAPQNSVLAETLARQVGEQSPLLRRLSPTDTDGVIRLLESKMLEVLGATHGEFVRALDPLAQDGAVSRFLRSLREQLADAETDRAKQLSTALAALDANDEQSLISRLMRETAEARRALIEAINPDVPASPLAGLKQTLTALLQKHACDQVAALEALQTNQNALDRFVREAVARIETRRIEEARAPSGGRSFEDSATSFIAAAVAQAPCTVEVIGATVGARPKCKVGDVAVRFTDESAFAGAGVVFEIKRDASYSVPKALNELDTARANRNASVGVFVMARSHAPTGFPTFARYGTSVLLAWDESDPGTDPVFQAGVFLGLALASRTRRLGDDGNLAALRDVEARIEAELNRLEAMEKLNNGIRRSSEGIDEELQKGRKQLTVLLSNAQEVLRALDLPITDEAAERARPLLLYARKSS